ERISETDAFQFLSRHACGQGEVAVLQHRLLTLTGEYKLDELRAERFELTSGVVIDVDQQETRQRVITRVGVLQIRCKRLVASALGERDSLDVLRGVTDARVAHAVGVRRDGLN